MAEKYDINSFDTRNASKQHRIPGSLKSAILTSSVKRNKVVVAEDMLALLRQIGGQISEGLCCRFGRNDYEVMRLAEACIPSKNNFMDAELFKYAVAYDLIISDTESDVFKSL